jgi:hypothetical protein
LVIADTTEFRVNGRSEAIKAGRIGAKNLDGVPGMFAVAKGEVDQSIAVCNPIRFSEANHPICNILLIARVCVLHESVDAVVASKGPARVVGVDITTTFKAKIFPGLNVDRNGFLESYFFREICFYQKGGKIAAITREGIITSPKTTGCS